ncbi:MAG: leucine-rich repeat protein [Ruminococcus sp.]|nr:leucine-rich repeat protein [Ruminococcus sp.]
MKKRMVSLLTVLAMVLSLSVCLPAVLVSAETLTSGDYEYEILEDGTAEITRYNGSDAEVEIPDTIDGYVVTSIGVSAFSGIESLTIVIIPDTVTNIGGWAFFYCESLISATIPGSVTSIGVGAFCYCTSLTSISIPDSVTYIGDGAFEECVSLSGSITIPNSVTQIEVDTFGNCVSLEYIMIPDSVTYIGNRALSGCDNLVIYCYSGSYAEQYAIDNDIEYVLLEKLGDVNGDDKVTTADVGLANSHAKGVKTLTDEQFVMADVNEDGSVTTADVGLINAHAKGVSLLW